MLFSLYSLSNLALIGCLALLVNMILGGPRVLYASISFLHPLHIAEKLILKLSEKLNRFRRSNERRKMRGVLLVLLVLGMAVLIGKGLSYLFLGFSGEIIEVVLLALFLSARQQLDWSFQILKLLKKAESEHIQQHLLPIRLVRRQQKEYDKSTILRGTIEAMAVTLGESVIAPIFYYIMAGWPGVLLVSLVTVMDGLLGYRNLQYENFGMAAARLHTVLQWVPSRIVAILLWLAAWFAPACKPLSAIRITIAHAERTSSTNAGWPIAAMAGALGITLGGPRAIFGSYIADQWIGEGNAQVDSRALIVACWLYSIAILLVWMLLLFVGIG